MKMPPPPRPVPAVLKDIKRKLYDISSNQDEPIVRRLGVITDVDNTTKSCSAQIGGGSVIIPSIKYLSSYYPVVDDVVWIDIKGVDMLCVGSQQADAVSYTSTTVALSPGTKKSIYLRSDQSCEVWFSFTWSGNGGSGTAFSFTVPFTSSTQLDDYPGSGHFSDNSTGEQMDVGCYLGPGSNTVKWAGPTGLASGNFGLNTVQVNTSDILSAYIKYPVAIGN